MRKDKLVTEISGNYTLQYSDIDTVIRCNGFNLITITIPTSDIPEGCEIEIENVGAGLVKFQSSATISGPVELSVGSSCVVTSRFTGYLIKLVSALRVFDQKLFVVTAGGITTLTATSAQNIILTGSTTQTVRLPNATTLSVNDEFFIQSNSSSNSNCPIQNSASTVLINLANYSFVRAVLTNNSTSAGVWDVSFYATNSATGSTVVTRNSSGASSFGSIIASAGITAARYNSLTPNFATSGVFRASASDIVLGVRNQANTGDLTLTKNSSDVLVWNAAHSIPSIQSPESILTDAATITPDFKAVSNFKVTLGGNRTLGVPSNLAAGQNGLINVWQDGTGSRTLSYSWVYCFPNGTAPTLSTGKYVRDCLSYYVDNYSIATVTMTIANPCVVTWTGHGLTSGQIIQLTTTGALPTGLSANTTYWVNVVNANTFNLSTSLANLQAGTYIDTSGSQSGIHTATNASVSIYPNLGMA